MGKYRVNISFSLSADVEPYGQINGIEEQEEVLDFDENSTFYADTFQIDGGDVWITVEAEDEDEAGNIALNLFESNAYFSDNSTEWEIIDANIYTVEEIKEPMTLRRAVEIAEAYLTRLYATVRQLPEPHVSTVTPSEEVKEAFAFILAECMKLRAQEVAHSA